MRASSSVAAALTVLFWFGMPVSALDLELELDMPAAPARKAQKKKPQKNSKPAALELELDLDLDLEPTPASPRAPDNSDEMGLDLELDLDLELPPVTPSPPPPPPVPAGPTGVLLFPADPFDDEEIFKQERLPVEPFHRFDIGLKVGGSLMNALTADGFVTTSGDVTASQSFNIPTALEMRIFPSESLRSVAISVEAGFFSESSTFKRDLPNDPDFASLTADWSMISIPVAVGISWDLPWRALRRRIGLGLRAAALGQYVRSTTGWGGAGSSTSGPAVSSIAPGWLAGAELNLKLGSGYLLLDLRTAQAFTDFGHGKSFAANGVQAAQPWASSDKGDMQGTTFMLGYRYIP